MYFNIILHFTLCPLLVLYGISNVLEFYGQGFLSPPPASKLQGYPL
jgi:hypothetical protein